MPNYGGTVYTGMGRINGTCGNTISRTPWPGASSPVLHQAGSVTSQTVGRRMLMSEDESLTICHSLSQSTRMSLLVRAQTTWPGNRASVAVIWHVVQASPRQGGLPMPLNRAIDVRVYVRSQMGYAHGPGTALRVQTSGSSGSAAAAGSIFAVKAGWSRPRTPIAAHGAAAVAPPYLRTDRGCEGEL